MSTVMTVRVDEELLARIKEAAQQEERSVSAYVLRVLREHLAEQSARDKPGKPKKGVMGSLRHLGAPDTLDAFRAARRELSESIAQGLDRTGNLLGRK